MTQTSFCHRGRFQKTSCREEDYGKHGYTKQEFDGEELVDIDEDEDEDDFIELDEALEDNDEE